MRSTVIFSVLVAAVASAPLPQFDLGALLGGGAGAPGGGSGAGNHHLGNFHSAICSHFVRTWCTSRWP
jgi:hypothetical protein